MGPLPHRDHRGSRYGNHVTSIAACIVLACFLSACGSGHSSSIPAGTAALVGGRTISQTSVSTYANYALSFFAWAYGTDIGGSSRTCAPTSRDTTCARVRRQTLLRLIEEAVIDRYAARHHISLSASDRARVDSQVSALIAHDTTASQLLAEHKIGRGFIQVLLAREALVRKVEAAVSLAHASRGRAYHLRQYRIPRLPGAEDRTAHRAAINLATDGSPVPDSATVQTAWVAPFRLDAKVLRALAFAGPGQFVGPFKRSTYYLVVELLGSGIHRFGRPARLALETSYFKAWLASQVRGAHPRCFDARGAAVTCPSPDH